MPGEMYKAIRRALILEQRDYKPGDLLPDGYLAWHEWAEVQRKAGIKQVQCGMCGLWKTPQELSGETIHWKARSRKGLVAQTEPVCHICVAASAPKDTDKGQHATQNPEQIGMS